MSELVIETTTLYQFYTVKLGPSLCLTIHARTKHQNDLYGNDMVDRSELQFEQMARASVTGSGLGIDNLSGYICPFTTCFQLRIFRTNTSSDDISSHTRSFSIRPPIHKTPFLRAPH